MLLTLKNRPDFLKAARAKRQATAGFILQARKRDESDAAVNSEDIRIGYTCSKKVGNAVLRNRAKRRLREVARSGLTSGGLPGWDYVLIGRQGATTTRTFAALQEDLAFALRKLHAPKLNSSAGQS
ncbi:ribonuclease P protein component [Falsihalocynthiibacter sp. S25ZX9]|uniref:ribonuclease P protein component n=1 Tax=Falsihalocynthiibacter sp. S25ZX9 TaxID=3240870 RepID=UPI00350F594A